MSKKILEIILAGMILIGSVAAFNITTYHKIKKNVSKIPKLIEKLQPLELKKKNFEKYIEPFYEKSEISELITKNLIKTTILVESEGNTNAISCVGAKGLMQLMKDTWEDHETKISYEEGVFNPYKNVEVGTKYLDWITEYCGRKHPHWKELTTEKKHEIITASYNGGIGRLRKNNWDINRMPEETIKYVQKIKIKY